MINRLQQAIKRLLCQHTGTTATYEETENGFQIKKSCNDCGEGVPVTPDEVKIFRERWIQHWKIVELTNARKAVSEEFDRIGKLNESAFKSASETRKLNQ